MGLFTLKSTDGELSSAILEKVKSDTIDYEKDFENWLENSPNVLLDEDEGSVIWIGRQVSATVGDSGKYPDLIGIDFAGDLVIVELKKGKTPREVMAQILEYSTWGSTLTYEDLNQLTTKYYKSKGYDFNKSLSILHQEVFNPDSEIEVNIEFNRNQKLFIVAEEISPIVRQVSQHLRTKYKINISCMEYEVLKSKQGEYFISTEKIVGYDDILPVTTDSRISPPGSTKWNEPVKVKIVINEAILKITKGEYQIFFTSKDIYNELIKEYPNINGATIQGYIVQDCVNHPSRKHYPSGQQDYYFRVDKGRYRLYNAKEDGQWDWQGNKVSD